MADWDESLTPREDPAVAIVEQMLDAAVARNPHPVRPHHSRPVATDALSICACVSMDDAPSWLIYNYDDGGLAWCRVRALIDPFSLVDAESTAAGHADPQQVLLWLQGQAPDPWSAGGSGWGNASVTGELQSRVSVGGYEAR
jgi:hypothetical protein